MRHDVGGVRLPDGKGQTVRLSIGIEAAEDIIGDLDQAFQAVSDIVAA